MADDLILSIDDFDGVSSTLYVEVRLVGGNLTGSWKKTRDTLNGQPPFPEGGTYVTPMAGGAMLSAGDGTPVCTLEGVVPGQNFGDHGGVDFQKGLDQYTSAWWHYPSTAPAD